MITIIYKYNRVKETQQIDSLDVAKTFVGSDSENLYLEGLLFSNCVLKHLSENYHQPTFENFDTQQDFLQAVSKDYDVVKPGLKQA